MAREKLDTERTLKLEVEYEGTRFAGWQLQPDAPTVQGALEKAAETVVGRTVRIHGAGRTDAGVHALGQVAHFRTASPIPPHEMQRALNAHLPEDVAVRSVSEAPEDFHARYSARGKTYVYAVRLEGTSTVFDRRVVWTVRPALDVARMEEAAAMLRGRHDFRGLASVDEGVSAERTLRRLELLQRPPYLLFVVEADGFLWKMVRRIVGSLVTVGRGKEEPSWVEDVLQGGGAPAGGPAAPAAGLVLLRVDYGDVPRPREVGWPPWPCFFLAGPPPGE
ncbi:MAG: tRNA pseudouridine(38-40) synthase TruA [Planctomycetota bacterium]|jgi:tRNA pseudouridine38-40 synthase